MTQIKLRRDTSANFTSKNPILGNGEPAYETDTKKLKIGDGATAYTQLEYFSAGGGGSTDITATLPLKIVDGVISLEVDGQTIQIVDGKLHANLDELGNEVNSLSGRVTAAEADIVNKASKSDLDKKENKITTTGALTLTEKIISNLNGMSLTADGVGVYSTSGTYIDSGRTSWSDSDRIIGSSGTSGYFVPGEYTTDSWRGGYIDMPYTFGYTMKMPRSASIYGYAGKYDAEGRFIPIIQVGYSHDNKSILYSDSLTLEKESGYDYTILRGQASAASGKATYVRTSGGRSNSGWTISDKSYQYLQWYVESNGTVTQIQRDGQTSDPRFYVATSASAAIESVARWKEVTVIRFAPTYNYRDRTYGVSANPFPAAEFGVYPTDKKIYEYASEADLIATGNLFDLSGQTAHNYLELNIGSGLAITDGKLTASSTAPTNMVTTDTAQTITGQKEFTHTILSLNQDLIRGQQSTSYRNGAGLSMGSNSTSTDGGVFAPQWKIYSTTGDVDRTETIITTYNQSKLNSSNFNTANKLVRLDSDGKLPAVDGSNLTNLPGGSSEPPANMMTTDTDQSIEGLKKFTYSDHSFIINQIKGTIGIAPGNNAVNSYDSAQFGTNDTSTWFVGAKSKTGYIYADSLIRNNGYSNSPILDSSNLGSYVDGTTITYTNNKLTATGGGSAPSNMMTTDTAQTITGHKSFSGELTIDKIDGDYGLYISTHPLKGAIRFGNTKRDVIIAGKGITTEAGDKFLTSGDKETIMGYMMPDYSTRTEVPWNTNNTAPTDGYVEIMGQGDGATNSFKLIYIINGTETVVSSAYSSAPDTKVLLPVICPKGTIYKGIEGAHGHSLHFISMKGAV